MSGNTGTATDNTGTAPEPLLPTVSPEEVVLPGVVANPLRGFLVALAVDLAHCQAAANNDDSPRWRGEARGVWRSLARALEHSYGIDYDTALYRVRAACRIQVAGYDYRSGSWLADRLVVGGEIITMVLDPEWEPGQPWEPKP